MVCIQSLILRDAVCLWQLISAMTFESTSPQGSRKGCCTLVCSQLPIHASIQAQENKERRYVEVHRIFQWSTHRIIRRLSGVLPERNVMRTEVVSQEDRLCVYELSMHTKGLYSDEKESKTFKHHRISEMYPFPHAIINISANSSFQPLFLQK